MTLLEKARMLSKIRNSRDETYDKFISSRRFRITKRFVKKEVKKDAKNGQARTCIREIKYGEDMYSANYISLSQKEYNYIETYYIAKGFMVEFGYGDQKEIDAFVLDWSVE